jgi:predicted NBD/HSP70 family sugar kinase
MPVRDLVPLPALIPPLDRDFRPTALALRAYRDALQGGGVPLVIGLERENGNFSRYEARIFAEAEGGAAVNPWYAGNAWYAERNVRFLLWQRGGHRIVVGGPAAIAEHLRRVYAPDGERKFEYAFFGQNVYERPLTVESCAVEEVPPAKEPGRALGGHLEGCRIGFDLGASDRKVSAVMDGRVIFSEEVAWDPRNHPDPRYHYHEITTALRSAAAYLPRVDAIGGSAAGIYIDNQPRVVSLFRSVPAERYGEVRDLFKRIQEEWKVPLVVINDGDVTALAGSMSLRDGAVLGIAMGSGEAAGYVDGEGRITGWLSELGFAAVDDSPLAPPHEWSGDQGCGSQYFSQQGVFRLARGARVKLPREATDAEKLKFVQAKLEAGDPAAEKIWRTIGVYFGYEIALYAEFYDIRHLLILGRCTSGSGGRLILEGASAVLRKEFPDLADRIGLQLPDEKNRRVGQAVAAASLPEIP